MCQPRDPTRPPRGQALIGRLGGVRARAWCHLTRTCQPVYSTTQETQTPTPQRCRGRTSPASETRSMAEGRPLTMVGRRRVNHRTTDLYDASASQTALGVSAGTNDTGRRGRQDSRRVACLGDDRIMVGVQIRPCYGPTYVIPVDEDLGDEEEQHGNAQGRFLVVYVSSAGSFELMLKRPSPTPYKVTNRHHQSERGQRAHQHHNAPRDTLHGSSSSSARALCRHSRHQLARHLRDDDPSVSARTAPPRTALAPCFPAGSAPSATPGDLAGSRKRLTRGATVSLGRRWRQLPTQLSGNVMFW